MALAPPSLLRSPRQGPPRAEAGRRAPRDCRQSFAPHASCIPDRPARRECESLFAREPLARRRIPGPGMLLQVFFQFAREAVARRDAINLAVTKADNGIFR